MTLPRILLVEDDPTSRAFMAAALEALPARVDAAADGADARALATTHAHALWLIDANLPDTTGVALLADLRESVPHAVAVAHTASQDHVEHEALRAAGFVDVLVKPIAAGALHAAVRRVLGLPAPASPASEISAAAPDALPDWDDAAALRALNGERSHVIALRRLFLEELPAQRRTVADALARGERDAAGQVLHRLRASCGFVGAARLEAAVRALETDLAAEMRSDPAAAPALHAFDAAALELLTVQRPPAPV